MKKIAVLFMVVNFFAVFAFAGVKDTVTQVSTINALLSGMYDGEMTLAKLRKYGNTGIGTFNSLDGEMVMLGGKIYKVRANGTVERPSLSDKTPFASVVFFEKAEQAAVFGGKDYADLISVIDEMADNPNIFYAVRIDGRFRNVKTRSVPKQDKPYPRLKDVTGKQPVFDFTDVEGTIIGFRCPEYVNGINVPGYHFHFINNERSAGGHVLDFIIEHVNVEIDPVNSFFMILPEGNEFSSIDLDEDRREELTAVEK